ncbi:Hypothetical protein NTJ_02751 [Nesidiocoris tenuis]|uniref:Uncharacterized protein n=1 Tax=Nesidiocoris tenuis TaxID=355587 RepID=A0ABN7AEZ5_9HEMI|nr:Hypothetical protein NTJ_02751 [Nesidiocoris tenuis]
MVNNDAHSYVFEMFPALVRCIIEKEEAASASLRTEINIRVLCPFHHCHTGPQLSRDMRCREDDPSACPHVARLESPIAIQMIIAVPENDRNTFQEETGGSFGTADEYSGRGGIPERILE